jgi:hypothetical protein
MKTTFYFTLLCMIMAATAADAQDYRKTGTYIRPTVSRDSKNTYHEWNNAGNIPRSKSISQSYLNDDYGENTYYPYCVVAQSLTVRSAPAYDAPVLTTIPCGEVVHLTKGGNYPWKSMKVNYFDSEEWTYKTAVGYVDSEDVRSSTPVSENRAGGIDNQAYAAHNHETRPAARPIRERSSIATPIVDKAKTDKPGRITIWTDCDDDGYIEVYVDGQHAGTLTMSFHGAEPSFGADGTIVRDLPPGKHTITARGLSKTWSGEVTVAPDQSIRKLLAAW